MSQPSTPGRAVYPAAVVAQITGMVWRVIVTDPLIALSHAPPGTVRTLVGRVEWHTPTQKFRACLDEIRQQDPDGQIMSVPVYLSPAMAQTVRQTLILAWVDYFTDPALHAAVESPVSGSLGGQIPLPGPSPYGELPPGGENAPEGHQGPGKRIRKRGPIQSPLSGLVDPKAAEQEQAFAEIEKLMESFREDS